MKKGGEDPKHYSRHHQQEQKPNDHQDRKLPWQPKAAPQEPAAIESRQFKDMVEKPRDMADEVARKKRKRKPPAVPWKKPKDMPRRPLSAYNIFFKQQRELMIAEAAGRAGGAAGSDSRSKKRSSKSVGIGFANLARTIAANWKDLPDATRAPFEARAALEKERYNEEMLVWRAKQKEEKDRGISSGSQSEPTNASPASIFTRDSNAAGASSIQDVAAGAGGKMRPTQLASNDSDSTQRSQQKKPRRSYHQSIVRDSGGEDFAPIHLTDSILSARWPDATPVSAAQNQQRATTQNQTLHSSMSRLEAFRGNTSVPVATQGFTPFNYGSIQSASGSFLTQHNPNITETDIMTRASRGGTSGMMNDMSEPISSGRSQLPQQQEHRLAMQQQYLFDQQQQMLQQHRLLQQQQYFSSGRRNTWSGSEQPGRYPSTRRFNNERLSTGSSSFPESWFELEETTGDSSHTPRSHAQYHSPDQNPIDSQLQPRHTKSRSNWFQGSDQNVHGMGDTTDGRYYPHGTSNRGEPIRYSPSGDLTGKLPAFRKTDTTGSDHPVKSAQLEGKMDDTGYSSVRRSLEEMTASGAAPLRYAEETRQQTQQGEQVQTHEASLQAFGVQFDDDTMDFLTRLQHEPGNFGNNNNS